MSFQLLQSRHRAAMHCRAVLGHRPRALPASTPRIVPLVSASALSVRAAVRNQPLASSRRILRLRRTSAAVQDPAPLVCQDWTDVALALPPFMISSLPLFCHTIKVNLIESEPRRPNAPAHRERPERVLSA